MLIKSVFCNVVVLVVFSFIFLGGCAEPAKKPVKVALKFSPGEFSTYKLTTVAEKGVEFDGMFPEGSKFKGGRNETRIEMTFSQQVSRIQQNGEAIIDITIKSLKYFSKVKENVTVDFDSSRADDWNKPLVKLIGMTYKLIVRPNGEVRKVVDVKPLRDAVKGQTTYHQKALEFLAEDALKDRHSFLDLPSPDANEMKPGDKWSAIKTFSFGLMGPKEYEKIYTIKDFDDDRIAVVEMNAIPSATMAEELHEKGKSSTFSKMFDNATDSYSGELRIDLTNGIIEKAAEKLQLTWVVVDPSIQHKDKSGPASLKMSVARSYELEKID